MGCLTFIDLRKRSPKCFPVWWGGWPFDDDDDDGDDDKSDHEDPEDDEYMWILYGYV